jgi:ribosomal protein S18 acetylase RimI-like enzyme
MLTTRTAIVDDAGLITRHRKAMFADMRDAPESVLDEMALNFEPWVRRMLSEKKYAGWITCDGDRAIASAGLLVLDWAPHFLDPAGEQRGYVLNVFVEPQYRRRGLAQALTNECLNEARRRGIRVVALHASKKGQPVYEKLGFTTSNEMLFVDRVIEQCSSICPDPRT